MALYRPEGKWSHTRGPWEARRLCVRVPTPPWITLCSAADQPMSFSQFNRQ